MKKKLTTEELKGIGDWLVVMLQHPNWQLFAELVSDRMVGMTQKILQSKEDDPWTRGYICGVRWVLKGKPEELIRQTQGTDRDTKTP